MGGQSGASLQMDKDVLDALKRIIRIGVVQTFDAVTRKGRVKFPDKTDERSELKFCCQAPPHCAEQAAAGSGRRSGKDRV